MEGGALNWRALVDQVARHGVGMGKRETLSLPENGQNGKACQPVACRLVPVRWSGVCSTPFILSPLVGCRCLAACQADR